MKRIPLLFSIIFFCACNNTWQNQQATKPPLSKLPDAQYCTSGIPDRFAVAADDAGIKQGKGDTTGMVWIPGTENLQGFYMDATEVTNAQFARFVKATGFVTTAEQTPDWEQLKLQLPPGTPKPPDSLLVPAALVFSAPKYKVGLDNPGAWWVWKRGASWKHPQGPANSLKGRDNYPVVQLSWDDAVAYCKWAGKRLPTAAEWENAAAGGIKDALYPWGNEDIDQGKLKANTWQGDFPTKNTKRDGFYGLAAVKSFAPNNYGLYDMAGNVWEWCSDDSKGEKVVKGGSFLCNSSYCEGYRIDKKMSSSRDTGLEHTGFRCVK